MGVEPQRAADASDRSNAVDRAINVTESNVGNITAAEDSNGKRNMPVRQRRRAAPQRDWPNVELVRAREGDDAPAAAHKAAEERLKERLEACPADGGAVLLCRRLRLCYRRTITDSVQLLPPASASHPSAPSSKQRVATARRGREDRWGRCSGGIRW